MSRTQKNKATEYHLGTLKAKLAKYRAMLLEPDKKSGGKGEGFDVMKSGDARVALIVRRALIACLEGAACH